PSGKSMPNSILAGSWPASMASGSQGSWKIANSVPALSRSRNVVASQAILLLPSEYNACTSYSLIKVQHLIEPDANLPHALAVSCGVAHSPGASATSPPQLAEKKRKPQPGATGA